MNNFVHNMTALTISLISVTVDSNFQPRIDGLDLGHVRSLESIAETWPPLKVVSHGDGYVLVDGFHRFAAAQNLGLETVAVEVLDPPEDGDLLGLAFALNSVHGRPLTLSDRRAFANRLLKAHPDWSDREIGRRSGLVQPTIARIRQDLESSEDIEPAETRIGRDGRSYPATQKPPATASAPASTARPRPQQPSVSLGEVLSRIFTPAERINQRNLVRYFERLAGVLEEQDKLKAFDTIDDGADACRAVLGAKKAKDLGERLGWSAQNILWVAEALGYPEEPSSR